jgi:PGAP1-like protein
LRCKAAASALALCALALAPATAAAEPPLTVPAARLRAALECHGRIGPRRPPPIIFAPGTGSDASQVWALGRGAFEALRRPVCAVAFPDHATADLQTSVQYLVHAIRAASRRAHRPVVVAGVSQGGLLARVALTYWPSLDRRVTDVVTAAAPHHGAPARAGGCGPRGCPPAIWQQVRGSHFLAALNNGRDETPGAPAWTTIRSATDEIVRPQTGPHPTSALRGAANILIQDVCPDRRTSHLATAVDSVTIAALADAIGHPGPARPARLPRDVCSHPYGIGLDAQRTAQFLAVAPVLVGQALASVPVVAREPPLRPWVRRGPQRSAGP